MSTLAIIGLVILGIIVVLLVLRFGAWLLFDILGALFDGSSSGGGSSGGDDFGGGDFGGGGSSDDW